MTRYELFKFLHLVGAVAWVGGGIGLSVLGWRLRKAGEVDAIAAIQRREDIGNFLFAPAALLTIGFGVAMVATTRAIAFGDLWILIGFGGVALSGAAEMGIAAPAGKRFMDAMASSGPGPEADAHLRRARLGNQLDLLVLLVVVWAMVARPML